MNYFMSVIIRILRQKRSRSLPNKPVSIKPIKCKHFNNGKCAYGSFCSFRHDQQLQKYQENRGTIY